MTAQTPAEQAAERLRQQVGQIEDANKTYGYEVPPMALVCLTYIQARALLGLLADPAAVDAAREQGRREGEVAGLRAAAAALPFREIHAASVAWLRDHADRIEAEAGDQ